MAFPCYDPYSRAASWAVYYEGMLGLANAASKVSSGLNKECLKRTLQKTGITRSP